MVDLCFITGLKRIGYLVNSTQIWLLFQKRRMMQLHYVIPAGPTSPSSSKTASHASGDPEVMAKFAQVQTIPATLDGVPKAIHLALARRIHQCTLKEPGLEVDALPTKRFWLV